jgi:ABC-2 type transport system ATP-binding protein
MRRKLGFVMAIVHRPDLLILDEPSTGVDPVSRIDLWRLASEAAASGAAVLMSTTYLDEAERAAHLVVLDRGRVLVQGSYDQVRADFAGVITRTDQPVRAEWAWRRGRARHEYWPDAAPSTPSDPSSPSNPPAEATAVAPDLEDIVIALSLARRDAVRS